MTEMPMRERMARALFGLINNDADWDACWHSSVQDGYLAQADTVLDAMREPSEEMVDAGTRAVSGDIADAALGNGPLAGLPGASALDNVNRQEIAEGWYAMIAAAKAGK